MCVLSRLRLFATLAAAFGASRENANKEVDDIQIQTDAGVDCIVWGAFCFLSLRPVISYIKAEQGGYENVPDSRKIDAENKTAGFEDDDGK